MSCLALYDICNIWDSPFYSRHNAQIFLFKLTRFNCFVISWTIFFVLV
jgi:hypothetical protein